MPTTYYPPTRNTPDNRISCALFVLMGLSGLFIIGVIVFAILRPAASATPTLQPTLAQIARQPHTEVPTVTEVPPTNIPTITPSPSPTDKPSATPTARPPTLTPVPATAIPRTATPTLTATLKPQARNCVSVVGDSVAYGDAVYEVPGVGYVVAHQTPLSSYVSYQFNQHGLTIPIFNRSAAAVGINPGFGQSYFQTAQYVQLLQDNCAYVVIVPWINDLSATGGPATAAANEVGALAQLVRAIRSTNPAGKILIVGYYQGTPAPWAAKGFAPGFTSDNVTAFNQSISAACSGGVLALRRVAWVDISGVMGGIGSAAVVGSATLQDIQKNGVAPFTDTEQKELDFYFKANPNGTLNGDGIHLSNTGKATLAAYLYTLMPL